VSIYSQPGSKGRIMGPFQTPWPTFLAWIVIGGTILMAIVWSQVFELEMGIPSADSVPL